MTVRLELINGCEQCSANDVKFMDKIVCHSFVADTARGLTLFLRLLQQYNTKVAQGSVPDIYAKSMIVSD